MNILGISYSGGHDSSACLVQNEELVFATAEERLSRICHDGVLPEQAIRESLSFAGSTIKDLDYAVFAWSKPLTTFAYSMKYFFQLGNPLTGFPRYFNNELQRLAGRGGAKKLNYFFGKTNVLFCDHHLAHAISAYAYSGMDEATVIVIDGRGAFEATSIWRGSKGRLTPVEIIQWPNSLGLFYAKFTKYLGFKPLSDEWKVMGLAAFGNPGVDLSQFISYENSPYLIEHRRIDACDIHDVSLMEKILGAARQDGDPIEQRHKDIAFAVQQETERAMLSTVHYAIKKTGIPNICLAGGVVMNCKANGSIVNDPMVEEIFIQPAASDDGAALGAALYPYQVNNQRFPSIPMTNPYLGASFSDDEILEALKKYKLSYEKMSNRAETIAQLLADSNIVGHFNNRMEFGARALGNRSILADPRSEKMKDLVNNSVKYRESWRPFAPSILEEHYFDYFETKHLSPFMIMSFPVKEGKESSIPAATHVDGTARPQSVSKETNKDYWELINAFYDKTGVPVVVNTSFNLKGEPIVRSPFDAIRTFHTSGLDALVLGNYLLLKNKQGA